MPEVHPSKQPCSPEELISLAWIIAIILGELQAPPGYWHLDLEWSLQHLGESSLAAMSPQGTCRHLPGAVSVFRESLGAWRSRPADPPSVKRCRLAVDLFDSLAGVRIWGGPDPVLHPPGISLRAPSALGVLPKPVISGGQSESFSKLFHSLANLPACLFRFPIGLTFFSPADNAKGK